MKKTLFYLFFLSLSSILFGFCIDKKQNRPRSKEYVEHYNSVDLSSFFSHYNDTLSFKAVVTDPLKLLAVAKDTLSYMEHDVPYRSYLIGPENFSKNFISSAQAKRTLEFLISVIEEDKKHGKGYRILNSDFIKKNFHCIKWSADIENAQEHQDRHVRDHKIRLTQYAVFVVPGSYTKTSEYSCALYELKRVHPAPPKFTKDEVLSGMYEKKEHLHRARPLIWLTQDGLEEAFMQGSILVKTPDEKIHGFKYYFSNGIPYDHKIKGLRKQQGYYYFKPMEEEQTRKFLERKNVVFAGNVFALGVGKLIGVSYKNRVTKKDELRLGILADTGGAFTKNLYHLDLYAGVYSQRGLFRKALWQTPNTVDAYLLYCKN